MVLNKFTFIGRLTHDTELNPATGDKKSYMQFSIAVDGINDSTTFINLVAFGNTAEYLAKYAKKGTLIIVEGKVDTSKKINVVGANDKTYTRNDVQFIVNETQILAQPLAKQA